MILAYQKYLGKFAKVLGIEKTPPPPFVKNSQKIQLFFWMSPLTNVSFTLSGSYILVKLTFFSFFSPICRKMMPLFLLGWGGKEEEKLTFHHFWLTPICPS